MRRRDFLRALAGVVAVPAVIERLVAEPEVRQWATWDGERWDDHETHLRAHRSFTTTSELDRLMKEVYSQPLLDNLIADEFDLIQRMPL